MLYGLNMTSHYTLQPVSYVVPECSLNCCLVGEGIKQKCMFDPKGSQSFDSLQCLCEIKAWLASNFFILIPIRLSVLEIINRLDAVEKCLRSFQEFMLYHGFGFGFR